MILLLNIGIPEIGRQVQLGIDYTFIEIIF